MNLRVVIASSCTFFVNQDSQRELSRELLPSVKDKMKTTYEACVGVERGSGRFDRMKGAMSTRSQMVVRGMFDDASALLLNGIKSMIDRLKGLITATSEVCALMLLRCVFLIRCYLTYEFVFCCNNRSFPSQLTVCSQFCGITTRQTKLQQWTPS